jgi:hypothetical protein
VVNAARIMPATAVVMIRRDGRISAIRKIDTGGGGGRQQDELQEKSSHSKERREIAPRFTAESAPRADLAHTGNLYRAEGRKQSPQTPQRICRFDLPQRTHSADAASCACETGIPAAWIPER